MASKVAAGDGKTEKKTSDAPEPVALTEAQKNEIASSLRIAVGLFMTAVTMVVPTRAPMIMGIKKGDAAATAKIMGLMSSCAAAIELFFNPLFGGVSDRFGRKPLLLMCPIVDAVLHTIVASAPGSLRAQFLDRMITGSMIFSFIAPVQAGLSDLWQGPKLAMAIAQNSTYFGIGCTVGPFIGAKLGGARSFVASSITFLAAWLWVACKVPETLSLSNRKEFDITAASPVRFLKLFQSKMMSVLATAYGLASFGDYVNIYDINFLYMKTVMGYGQSEVGNFATAVGASQVLGGQVMSALIKSSGQKTATFLSNMAWVAAMAFLGTSRTAGQLMIALSTMTFGHQRSTAITAYLVKHGQAANMGRAEIAAAQMNLGAVIKVFVPVLYGNLFAWATSKGRKMPGAPYFLISVLAMLSQLAFSSVDPEKDS